MVNERAPARDSEGTLMMFGSALLEVCFFLEVPEHLKHQKTTKDHPDVKAADAPGTCRYRQNHQ